MAFYALIFSASNHHASLRGPDSTADSAALLRLSYKTQAIKLITDLVNKRLHKCGRDSIDALLISIAVFAVYGGERDAAMEHAHPQSPLAKAQSLEFYGKKRFVPAHMQALYLLVRQTGGLESIKMYGLAHALAL
jgi:hypothetical protein